MDLFGLTLNYFRGDYAPINPTVNPYPDHVPYFPPNRQYNALYNGNISSMMFSMPLRFNPHLYNYKYDQLNRLVSMDASRNFSSNENHWQNLATIDLNMEKYSYDANGNITRVLRNGNLSENLLMDSLTYFYTPGTNRLDHIRDRYFDNAAHSDNYNARIDIRDQPAGSYLYDAIGNLKRSLWMGDDTIRWNVYGKVTEVVKRALWSVPSRFIHYYYDPSGNKTGEAVRYGTGGSAYYNHRWYVRDAQGNVLATYEVNNASGASAGALKLKEHHMYGSSRLGIINRDQDMDENRLTAVNETNLGNTYLITFTRGNKFFEVTNHLGSVVMVLADLRTANSRSDNPALVSNYIPVMAYASDYTPFGRQMVGRVHKSPWNYRYGFNGKEYDNDVQAGGNLLDYGNRLYDPMVGRFWSVDPLTRDYPELTPYQFASNSPIQGTDLDGLEISYHYDDPRFGVVITQAGDNLSRQIPPEHLKFIPQARNKRSQGIMNENASMVLDNIPVVGTVKGAIEGAVGYDAAGNELSTFQRAIGLFPYVGKAKNTFKILKAADKADKASDISKAVHKVDEAVSNEKALVNYKADPTANRVKLRKDVKETIKENQPRNDKGEMIDPNTRQPLQPDKIDIGHKPGQEWRMRKEMHKKKGSTRKEVIKEENNPDLYQLEDRSSNRSHKHEQKSNDK